MAWVWSFLGLMPLWNRGYAAVDAVGRDLADRRDRDQLARAIQVGIASFPSEGARRLVLLSDGNENVGRQQKRP